MLQGFGLGGVFYRESEGLILANSETETGKPKVVADENTARTIKNLWPYMWPQDRPDLKLRVFFALGFLIAAKLLAMAVPFFYKAATDLLTGNEADLTVLPAALLVPIMMVAAYATARIFATALEQLRDALFAKVGQHAVRQLAFRTFTHMHKLSLRFHLERKTGGLSRIIERGVKGIESIVRFSILNTIPTILEFALTATIFAVMFGFSYVGVLVLTIGLYAVWTVKASDWRIAIRREMNESDTDANSKNVDSLLNFETVKYFGNEQLESRRFDDAMAGYEKAATKTWTSLGWLNFGQALILYAGIGTCMAMSASAVMAGTQTVGDFVFINALLMQLALPLNFIGFIYREIKQGLTDIETMFSLLEVEAEVADKPNAKTLDVSSGEVSFENVSFAYNANRPILKNISFTVPPGKTVALVGPSGAGKSTISRLLFRFYDTIEGAVKIDGQDVRDVSQNSLRAAIGMVPQDTVLFNDTIAYNIGYGRPDATREEIIHAAEMAQISDFIRQLPEGYDTQVGERGLKLSGGEKQRVAIARTLLKAPPIIMLDEATSALDTQTEQEIQSALDDVSKGRTTLIIAHRLSTVVSADEIIVLQAGEIAERGSHRDLMDAGGLYASMWDRQREASEAEDALRRARESDTDGFFTKKTQPAE
jgi:ATP-binding cassette subfamily B protein